MSGVKRSFNIFTRHTSRERTGLAATVICYRGRSAIRDVGKVFGLSDDALGLLAGTFWGRSDEGVKDEHARRAGFDHVGSSPGESHEAGEAI